MIGSKEGHTIQHTSYIVLTVQVWRNLIHLLFFTSRQVTILLHCRLVCMKYGVPQRRDIIESGNRALHFLLLNMAFCVLAAKNAKMLRLTVRMGDVRCKRMI